METLSKMLSIIGQNKSIARNKNRLEKQQKRLIPSSGTVLDVVKVSDQEGVAK